ncbi:MAG: hypothetical protein ACMV1D_10875 [Macromonas sp.]
MAQILKNNVSGVLGLALSASGTSMTLLDASNFPTPPSGDFYLLTLIGLNTNGQESTWEVVKVVAKASNTLTIVRAQEGTTAAAWPVATTVQLRLTAGSVTTPDVVAAHVGSSGASHAAASTSVAGFMSAADKTKLDGVATNANNYAHPANHPPSIITQDAENRFVTDAEKSAWNGKEASGTAAAAMTAHTSAADPHDQYLPKAGGTMSGSINFAPAQTWPTFNQSTTGNAATATKLANPRTINGVLFDGNANITINAVDSTAREPSVTAGTTSQYWRGDKSWRDFFTDVRAATLTGLSTATNAVVSATDTVLGALGKLQKQVSDNLTTLTSHTGNSSNPHSVTKAQVGLGNVDNTSDASKPISTAVQTALNAKQDTLVSGTNIKTLNGESLLGAGNLVLQLAADQPSAVTYTYDASGRVETTTETLPTGTRTTTVTYSEAGQVKTVTVTLGTSTRTTQYAYDQYGVLTGTTSTES